MVLRRFRRAPDRHGRRQRGAAAIEFSISLIFLVPLILGMIDYGYYFWIGVNTVEAAKAGVVTASRMTVGSGNCLAAAGTTADTAGTNAVTAHLTQTLGATLATYATIDLQCVTAPFNPTWQITVTMNYPPILRVAPLPAGSPTGRVRFVTQTFFRRGL